MYKHTPAQTYIYTHTQTFHLKSTKIAATRNIDNKKK